MLQAFLGIIVFIGLVFLLSESKPKVAWRLVFSCLALQFILGLIFLKIPLVRESFSYLGQLVLALETATEAGTSFMFGYLGGGSPPFEVTQPNNNLVIAFKIIPIVIVVSAFSSVLFYWGVLQKIIRAFQFVFEKTLRIDAVTAFSLSASLFFGIVETLLLVKFYLKSLSRSQLFTLMVVTMSTVAGTVMALYASVLSPVIPEAAGQLLVASVISAPAALLISHVWIPKLSSETTQIPSIQSESGSSLEALINGTSEGVQMAIHIVAVIIVLFASIKFLDLGLEFLPDVFGSGLSLQRLVGWVFYPFCWLMGIPAEELTSSSQLMATKVLLNEFVAYLQLSKTSEMLSPQTVLTLTYALCGFANFASLGIMVGGLNTMVPERRKECIDLAPKALIAGNIVTMMTGCIVRIISF